jgi:hypothetical protein
MARFASILKAGGLRSLVLMKRFGLDEPAEVPPRRWSRGHGGVYAFALSHGPLFGPSTHHVFDDVELGPDASSHGGGTFSEAVRCSFEAFCRCGTNGGVSVKEHGGESSSCLPNARSEAP